MTAINKNFRLLGSNYLFREIEEKATKKKESNPACRLFKLGIGDISLPFPPSIIAALSSASEEFLKNAIGYGPSEGYLFLRQAIRQNCYQNSSISEDEIFISNGTKNDLALLQSLFAETNTVAIFDPSYPVYTDVSIIYGKKILFLNCTENAGFIPPLPKETVNLIYICSPHNPIGVAFDKETLKSWVQYAKKNRAVIIFDGAYEAFIESANVCRSIFEIDGAEEVAIELRSFSKSAGFTNLRCSYLAISKKLKIGPHFLHALWKRLINSTTGGVSYPIQKAAEAVFSSKGNKEIKKIIQKYKDNTKTLKKGLENLGYTTYGGIDAPYIWCKIPSGLTSIEFFDYLLDKTGIICTPGSGFGKNGEGFVRFSGFAAAEDINNALVQLKNI